MAVIYAMSDIHGCYTAMKAALDHIDLKADDQLILVGDYVDGGEKSFQVLNEIMRLEKAYPRQIVTLLGNHDEWFCNWLFPEDSTADLPTTIVDFKTVSSFFNETELAEIVKVSQNWTTSSGSDRLEELLRQKIILAPRFEKLVNWLKQKQSAKRYYDCQNQIFVHAGIDEEAGEYWKQVTMAYIFTEKFPATKGDFYKDVVSGHIHSEEVAQNEAYLGSVYWDRHNHFFIDGHTVTSGVVPILKYETGTNHYSSFRRQKGSWIEYSLR